MISIAKETGKISLPLIIGEYSMIPFNLKTLEGLPGYAKSIASKMLDGVKNRDGIAFFTIHGEKLKKGETLRRGGPHTDGNYEPLEMTFGGGGWKVGQDGRNIDHPIHKRQYNTDKGGIIICSNYHACKGWIGEYDALPNKGGDCSHIDLGEGFDLKADTVYYGNNHFIHESLPMNDDVHRVMARITMPENHEYEFSEREATND